MQYWEQVINMILLAPGERFQPALGIMFISFVYNIST